MKMQVSTEAKDALCHQLGENQAFILASRTKENHVLREKSCAKGSRFEIIPLCIKNNQGNSYTQPIENEQFQVYTSAKDQARLGDELKLDYCEQLNSYTLENSDEVLDYNMKLKNYFFS